MNMKKLCGMLGCSLSSSDSFPHARVPGSGAQLRMAGSCLLIAAVFMTFAPGATASVTDTQHTTNWAGYADFAPTGQAFTSVSGNWVVPTVTPTGSGHTYSAFWLGLDGNGSGTVEQIGISADTSGSTASYSAWFEMYPSQSYPVAMLINPGDQMSASVTYTGSNTFVLSMANLTNGETASITQTSSTATRHSAEWIAEAPYSGGHVLPLADFGSVTFTGASAALNGNVGTISSFSHTDIVMNNSNSGLIATPSPLRASGSAFSVSVPEPATLVIMGGMGLFLLLPRRKSSRLPCVAATSVV